MWKPASAESPDDFETFEDFRESLSLQCRLGVGEQGAWAGS